MERPHGTGDWWRGCISYWPLFLEVLEQRFIDLDKYTGVMGLETTMWMGWVKLCFNQSEGHWGESGLVHTDGGRWMRWSPDRVLEKKVRHPYLQTDVRDWLLAKRNGWLKNFSQSETSFLNVVCNNFFLVELHMIFYWISKTLHFFVYLDIKSPAFPDKYTQNFNMWDFFGRWHNRVLYR